MSRRTLLGWAAILSVLGITAWASSPWWPFGGGGLAWIPGGDKGGHVLVLGALAAACVLAFTGARVAGHRLGAAHVLALVALGAAADELAQAFIPSRSFDLADLAASLVGIAVLGGAAALLVRRREGART